MNHDEDEDLCMFDPGSWQIALACALVAVVLLLIAVAVKGAL